MKNDFRLILDNSDSMSVDYILTPLPSLKGINSKNTRFVFSVPIVNSLR